ncbi:unnamed protein product, partial [Prunus brigantina]
MSRFTGRRLWRSLTLRLRSTSIQVVCLLQLVLLPMPLQLPHRWRRQPSLPLSLPPWMRRLP